MMNSSICFIGNTVAAIVVLRWPLFLTDIGWVCPLNRVMHMPGFCTRRSYGTRTILSLGLPTRCSGGTLGAAVISNGFITAVLLANRAHFSQYFPVARMVHKIKYACIDGRQYQ
jgi:hypothetical protein